MKLLSYSDCRATFSPLLCVLCPVQNLIMRFSHKLSLWPVAHNFGLRIRLAQKIKKLTICLLAFVRRPTNEEMEGMSLLKRVSEVKTSVLGSDLLRD